MKKYIIAMTFVAICLTACHKDAQIEPKTPAITEQTAESLATEANFTWTVDFPGKISSVVEISESKDMSDSQTFGSETEKDSHSFMVTATGLKEATNYYYRYLVWNPNYVNDKFKMEVKSFTTKADVPKVRTVEVTDVTRTTAKVIGEVTDESGATVTERGVCWSTNKNPTTAESHANSGTGTGSFSVELTGLKVGKTYYVRAYAINKIGTSYGDELSFTTGDAVKPTVTTTQITNIDWRTAKGGGEVTDDGDATVTERGICWSTSHDPEITDSHASSGMGTGSYNVNLTGLTAGTTYYVRAYAKNIAGTAYGNEVSFTSKAPELPTVTTSAVTDISYTTAKGGGNVTSDGGIEIIERGICWSTSQNPEITDSHATSGNGTGSYTVNITGLTAETKYYVRSYAKNSVGIGYGEEKSFTTKAVTIPTVTTSSITNITSSSATGGGQVTDDGGAMVIERGICWSTSQNPEITSSHASSGSGMGSYAVSMTGLAEGTTYYVRAYATNSKGTGYGEQKSFKTLLTGVISGLFSVSSGKQVYFSQGNLQYRASDGKWRFAEHQYDYVGNSNSSISSSYNGWIDLFGWGTSGYDGKNPYMTSTTSTDYGNGSTDIAGTNYDWGVYNKITNGGNQASLWRTLTKDEWVYVFNTRSTASGIRYAKASVNGMNGVILLPDDWNSSYYSLSSTNSSGASFSSNTITASQWATLEQHGAVFLPASGCRHGTSVNYVGSYGYYWSASYSNENGAYYVYFNSSGLNPEGWDGRDYGLSVRLVRSAQ